MKGKRIIWGYFSVVLLVFILFFYILLRPSTQSKAIREVGTCLNSEDVKAVWYKYRSDLFDDDDYCQVVRDKLTSFHLTNSEIGEIKKWLPTKTENLNIIIIPDLSLRIKDPVNNPDQITNDTALLSTIWRAFEKNVRTKMNSKDRLVVDVADPDQGQGQFKRVADSLVFDLADFKNKSNRLYFNEVSNKFQNNIREIYNIASVKTTGADYVYYFSEKLPTRIIKSTLDDNYRNIVIILTDGYLELSLPNNISKSISPNSGDLQRYCSSGNTSNFQFPNQTAGMDLSDVEVYLFEVNERKSGEGCDYRGLKRWWIDWFKQMHVKNAEEDIILKRQDAISLSKNSVQAIFNIK